jgi:hypothetical protein
MLTAAALLTFADVTAHASPIRPDIKKLLAQPAADVPRYVPARAGWNGPEISTARTAPNPTYETLSPANAAREVRSALVATMMPDLRVVALLALVILLLRRIRKHEQVPATSAAAVNGTHAPVAEPHIAAPVGIPGDMVREESRPAA